MQRPVLVIISLFFALASPLQADEKPDTGVPVIAAATAAMDASTNLRQHRNIQSGPIIEARSAASESGEYDLSYLLVIGVGVVGLLWIRRQAHNL